MSTEKRKHKITILLFAKSRVKVKARYGAVCELSGPGRSRARAVISLVDYVDIIPLLVSSHLALGQLEECSACTETDSA